MRVIGMIYAIFALVISIPQHIPDREIVQKRLVTISFLNKNAALWVVTYGGPLPIEAHEKLLLGTEGHQKIICRLSDLEGAVHINNAATALQYVRLRTSPSTWYMWSGPPIVEIVNRKQATQLPNYGLRKNAGSKATSGFIGILSDSEFKRGNFSKPKIRKTIRGFAITRWLLTVTNSKLKVELLEEAVGFIGTYQFRVLQIKDAPNLVATQWQIPRFE